MNYHEITTIYPGLSSWYAIIIPPCFSYCILTYPTVIRRISPYYSSLDRHDHPPLLLRLEPRSQHHIQFNFGPALGCIIQPSLMVVFRDIVTRV